MTDVGFVGLGTMGGRIAQRLLDAGNRLYGYNRTRERARWLQEAGVLLCDSPRQVAERSEVVFSMVTGSDALHAITDGPDGVVAGLRAGQVYVDMTTASPAVSRALAARVSERGAAMLDAPVSGSVSTLEEGRLAIMVGGERTVLDQVEPLLRQIGPTVIHVGGNGLAVLAKVATNLSLAVQMVAFSEGVLLAEKGGIERDKAVEVLLDGVIASPMLRYRGPFVLHPPAEAWFDVDMMQKDLQLTLEAGRQLDVPLPTTAVADQLLTAARAMGYAGRDFAVLFDVLAAIAGVAPGKEEGDA